MTTIEMGTRPGPPPGWIDSPSFKHAVATFEPDPLSGGRGLNMRIGPYEFNSNMFYRLHEFPARLGLPLAAAWACLALGDGTVMGRVHLDPKFLDVVVDYLGYTYSLSMRLAELDRLPDNLTEFIARTGDAALTINRKGI